MEVNEKKLIEIDNLNTDEVSVAFELILEQLSIVEQELKDEGAKAFQCANFFKASKLGESGSKLNNFKDKLKMLVSEWDSDIEPGTKQRVKSSFKSHSKSPKTGLYVKLRNNSVISENYAAETFVKVIDEFGVDKVFDLGLKINKIDLVSKIASEIYNQTHLGQYYICTHSNTKTKKKQLEKIADLLNEKISVKILD